MPPPQKTKHQPFKQLAVEYDVPVVKAAVQIFEKEIIKPVQFHISIEQSKNSPKCHQHNNVLTMYCKNDNKPLCASCLYLNPAHKTHKLLPLAKAQSQLRQGLNDSIALTRKGISELKQLLETNQQNFKQVQQQYPQMIQNLHQFYLELHQYLVFKKTEMIEQISQNWARLRYAHHVTKSQLEKMASFVKMHLQRVTEKNQKEKVLHQRCVAVELAKVREILTPELGKIEENRFEKDIKRIVTLRDEVEKQLVFTNLFAPQKEKKNVLRHSINFTTTSPLSKSKNSITFKNLSPSKAFSPSPNNNNNSSFTMQKMLSSMVSTSKNRHSKTDLLKKMEVEEHLRQKQLTEAREKNLRLHYLINEKTQQQQFFKKNKQDAKKNVSPNQIKVVK